MVTQMFETQIMRNMEAYINDIVVKSKKVEKHLADLVEEHKLRLNASKCSFRDSTGKFLGYMITHYGIKVNQEQISAINSLHSPRTPKRCKG